MAYYEHALNLPEHIYNTTGSENGLAGTIFTFDGIVVTKDIMDAAGVDVEYAKVSTDMGTVLVLNMYAGIYKESMEQYGESSVKSLYSDNPNYYVYPEIGEKANFLVVYSGYSQTEEMPVFYLGASSDIFSLLEYEDPVTAAYAAENREEPSEFLSDVVGQFGFSEESDSSMKTQVIDEIGCTINKNEYVQVGHRYMRPRELNTVVENCVSFDLTLKFTNIISGNPYGEWLVTIETEEDVWEEIGTVHLNGKETTVSFTFDEPTTIRGILAGLIEWRDINYSLSYTLTNVVTGPAGSATGSKDTIQTSSASEEQAPKEPAVSTTEQVYEPTTGQKNALRSAKDYLRVMAFSYTGLIEQLEYEGYSHDEAVYGVDNCGADWFEQAALSAKEYLEVMSFSRTGLIEQLQYEGFTYDQAVYGVEQNGY